MSSAKFTVNLKGKTAVVTGAARGMGAMFAIRLAESGANVVAVDILSSDETKSTIEKAGGKCLAMQADITDVAAVKAAADETKEKFGSADILINNAAIHPTPTAFGDLTFDYWKRTMSINLDSMFIMTQAFLPQLTIGGWGRIINMSSSSANAAPPMGAPYVASKAAIIGLTRAMATEFGKEGITVNAISPNPVRTPGADGALDEQMFQSIASSQPVSRVMVPEDVAGAILFLCSDASEFITGQNFHVDGGAIRGC